MAATQRRLEVLLGDMVVGTLRFTHEGRREHAAFEYAAAWLAAADAHEVEPTLPLMAGPQFPPHGREFVTESEEGRYPPKSSGNR